MSSRFHRAAWLCVCVLAGVCGGCATNPWQASARQSPFDRPTLAPPLVTPGKRLADLQSPRDGQRREGSRIAPLDSSSEAAVASSGRPDSGLDAAAMSDVLAELQAVGAIDPAAQQQLLEDLRGTDPALWPQMLQIFRATLAYQRQLQQQENQPSGALAAAASQASPQQATSGLQSNPQAAHGTQVARAGAPTGGHAAGASTVPSNRATAPAYPTTAAQAAVTSLQAQQAGRGATTVQSTAASQASPPTTTRLPAPQNIAVPSPAPASISVAQAAGQPTTGQLPPATAATSAPVGIAVPTANSLPVAQASAVGSSPVSYAIATSDGAGAVPVQGTAGGASVATPSAQQTPAPFAPSQNWETLLSETIRRLEADLSDLPRTEADVRRRAALRMLYLAAGQNEQAARPIDGIPPVQQDFWAKEMYGLGVMLDTQGRPQLDQRAAEAATHLGEAHARLGEMARLIVRNLAFCTEVTSFGVYKPFAEAKFSPGQEVLLYAEIDHFKSEATEDGYHTSLRSSYQILNPQGHRVADHEFSVTEDHCRNPRRDFFILYNLFMPKRIYPGRYTLQLTIEDTLSHKIGQSSIDFEIE